MNGAGKREYSLKIKNIEDEKKRQDEIKLKYREQNLEDISKMINNTLELYNIKKIKY